MAGSKSNYLENELLDHVLGGGDYVRPSLVYVGLFTSSPAETGIGIEVSGGSYARVPMVNDSTHWPSANNSIKRNGTPIVFATATANWGTIVAFAIFDELTGGNMLFWGDFVPKVIESGDTAEFATSSITITED